MSYDTWMLYDFESLKYYIELFIWLIWALYLNNTMAWLYDIYNECLFYIEFLNSFYSILN